MVACFHGQASQKAFVYLAWLQCVKVSSTDIISMYQLLFLETQRQTRVGNIWFLNPLVLSKWEDLAFSVCMLFEESVFIFQFLNNKMHNYVLFNTFVHFIIQKLKNKHTFLKTEKAKFSRRENLVFILFEEIVFFSIF